MAYGGGLHPLTRREGALIMIKATARADGGPAAVGPAAGGSGKITREAVLAAALEIIDRDGADALR
jgi:hypothetical protein